MSEKIDWSKAPEWAKKHGLSGAFKSPVWFDDEKYTYVDGQKDGKSFFYADACTCDAKDFSQVAERPSTPSWSGEGLPPVGVVCEYRSGYVEAPFEYCQCEIIAHFEGEQGKNLAAFKYVAHDGVVQLGRGAPQLFRPIRTPEQIAADERHQSVMRMSDIVGDIEKVPSWTDALEALYDAGLRFTS